MHNIQTSNGRAVKHDICRAISIRGLYVNMVNMACALLLSSVDSNLLAYIMLGLRVQIVISK